MEASKKKKKLSQVLLYKNDNLYLIEELKNVYIKRVKTCPNSINVILDFCEYKVDTFIDLCKIKHNALGKNADNYMYSGNSFLNIFTNPKYDFVFSTSNLDLYIFYPIQDKKNTIKKKKDVYPKNNDDADDDDDNDGYGDNNKTPNEKCLMTVRNAKEYFLMNKGKSKWNYKTEDLKEKKKKIIPMKFRKIFFCSFEFYAINQNKEIYKWNSDADEKEIIHNYNSKFLTYFSFFDNIKIVSISCGMQHTLFLTDKGNCYVSGYNDCYQIGIKKKGIFNVPQLVCLNGNTSHCGITMHKKDNSISLLKKVKYIAAGHSHNIIVTVDNEMYGWGFNIHGQLFLKESFVKTPTLILNQMMWEALLQQQKKIKKKEKRTNSNEIHKTWQIEGNFKKEISELNAIEKNIRKTKNFKNKKKLVIKKVCCGFSFSCFLLKNKKCYLFGKENKQIEQTKYNQKTIMFKKINANKRIDDIFCNFFDIILVMHLSILKVEPPLIQTTHSNSIFLFLNFKVHDFSDFKVELLAKNHYKKEKEKCLPLSNFYINDEKKIKNVDFHFHCGDENKKYLFDNLKFSENFSKITISNFWEVRTDHLVSLDINHIPINSELFLKLYNSHIAVLNKEKMIITNYQGKIKEITPNNFALKKNIKVKIKINKVPIYVKENNIYIMYLFLHKREKNIYKFTKGKLNKRRNCISTKLSFFSHYSNTITCTTNDNNKYTEEMSKLTECDRCCIFFSFHYYFFPNSFTVLIRNPEIKHIYPDTISINENKKVFITMLQEYDHIFEDIHVILYNVQFKPICQKAYYDYDKKSYFFSSPLISNATFTKIQSGYIQ